LGNATGASTYHDAASLSSQFLSTQLYNHTTNEVIDGVDASTCQPNPPGTGVEIALFLEGGATFGAVTGNETMKTLMNNLAQNTIKNVSSDNSLGIVEEKNLTTKGQEEYGGHFIRALAAVYEFDTADGGLRDYIRAFTAVQYNGLVDLAGDADVYAGTWTGPKAKYDFINQTTAIDVLLSGLTVANTTGSTMNHKTMVGAIVGGTIGGSIALFMILLLLVLIVRQRRRIATAAPFPKPFEEPSRDSIQLEDHQDAHQHHRGKHLMPPPSSSTTNVPRNDSPLEESHPPTQEHAESQGITIGSLIWELNELLRRNNRAVREESLPTYAASQSETLASH